MVIAGNYSYWQWRWTEIERFSEEVPDYVLQKAIQVKEALPGCKLWVRALSDRNIENPLFGIDPFLVLQAGEKCFYLECWDERAFEEQEQARRVAHEAVQLTT